MATFQKEIQLVWTKKWSSKESAWFGEPRCNLGSKVASSIVFHYFSLFFTIFHCFSRFFFSLVLEVEIMHEWKTFHGWRRKLLIPHPPFHF
jgi:hypothetical protein